MPKAGEFKMESPYTSIRAPNRNANQRTESNVKPAPPIGSEKNGIPAYSIWARFAFLWTMYKTDIRITPIGYIYGAMVQFDAIRRRLDYRSADARHQESIDKIQFEALHKLHKKDHISCSEDLRKLFSEYEAHEATQTKHEHRS